MTLTSHRHPRTIARIPRFLEAADTLDEVVGPMVNRSVIVYGRWKRRPGYKDKLLLKEIDLDEDASD